MNHVLSGLAANASLPPELLDRLIAVADTETATHLVHRADLSHAQAIALASRAEEIAVSLAHAGMITAEDVDPAKQPYVALALLAEGVGRSEWAQAFARAPDVKHRVELAACPGLSPDVVEVLASDADVRVVAELALWTTSQTAARLAVHSHAEVRRAVAANEATPPAVLAALLTEAGMAPAQRCLVCDREETPFVHDPECPRLDCDLLPGDSCDGSHESTREQTHQLAIENPGTPDQALADFADHPSLYLRCLLAGRPNLPAAICARLVVDPHPEVRACLAEKRAMDGELIHALAFDREHEVRRRLAHNPVVPLDVLTHLASATRLSSTLLPRIASASPAELEELAASSIPAVRTLVAHRRDLPPALRDTLATDPDAKVLKSIAPHPGLSERLLRSMVDRHGVRVAAKVATNPDATPALLEDLARHRPVVQKAFREIARHRNASVPALLACLADPQARPIAASHAALPPPIIQELLTDPDERVAEAAAANPSLPLNVMWESMPPS
ncbi:hypothetical protein Kisp01_71300 [Kineosporia sp. NBRC 101677]|uniref:hypothetical protein n=1 Tax=Kineosporia sp. NBRC 101677 TaxID=3032197 RepID=UPI0024A06E3A|nr:hypothetical protein [Kineosporia sp. NBRC 101677]GLY20116.1 hypothetical protein Kisp01_71300 [Kineosporia sp. NBRC 101677]